jgi:hypothetical protein
LARGKIITIIILHFPRVFIDIGCGGSGSQILPSRRRRDLDISGGLLMCLLFFIGVTDDNLLVVVRRSEEVRVEVTEQPFGELRVLCSVSEETFFIWR